MSDVADSTAPTTPTRGEDPADLITFSRYEDIARRIISGHTRKEICQAVGVSHVTLKKILGEPEFKAVYTRAHAGIYHDVDKLMRDELASPNIRTMAIQNRALTLLADIVDEISHKVSDNDAKAQDMRVGVDAAFGVMDRVERNRERNEPTGTVTQIFHLQQTNAVVLQDALAEAGIDLTHITRAKDAEAIDVAGDVVDDNDEPPGD